MCQNQLKCGGACALAKAVGAKPRLALLHLDENEISEAGIDALKVGIQVFFPLSDFPLFSPCKGFALRAEERSGARCSLLAFEA